jgi:hypothetical protein
MLLIASVCIPGHPADGVPGPRELLVRDHDGAGPGLTRCASDVGGNDIGGVPVETGAGAVVSHGGFTGPVSLDSRGGNPVEVGALLELTRANVIRSPS